MKNIMLNESLANSLTVEREREREREHKLTKGISLIVLVITIIIVIILAGAIILSLSDNNPIESANKAKFVSSMKSFQEELNMYNSDNYIKTMGIYNSDLLNADMTNITYTRKW